MPDFDMEKALLSEGYSCIAGVDEVGRGPWAGPVVAAAVILNPEDLPEGARDSKKLSATKREALAALIHEKADVGIGVASVEEIDEHNILQATFMAMKRAVDGLSSTPDYALIDGHILPKGLAMPAQAIKKGDDKVLSIACASIVAKVYRDKLMEDLHAQYPYFGWKTNAGYGTQEHQKGLDEQGVTPHHRRSFAPIQKRLEGI